MRLDADRGKIEALREMYVTCIECKTQVLTKRCADRANSLSFDMKLEMNIGQGKFRKHFNN